MQGISGELHSVAAVGFILMAERSVGCCFPGNGSIGRGACRERGEKPAVFSPGADIDIGFAWLVELSAVTVAVVGRPIFVSAVIIGQFTAGVGLDACVHPRLSDGVFE